ncbi:MAG: hypothetical protein M0Z36_06690 [Thermaerobacter sp.]|nr:hypothetical protein [Thermaerobacter sp.]
MIDLATTMLGGPHVLHLAAGSTSTSTVSSTPTTTAPTQNLSGISTAMGNVKGLLASLGNGVMGVGAAGGGLMFGYHALMRNMSGGDGQADAQHLAGMKKVAVGTALVVCAGAIGHFAAGAL